MVAESRGKPSVETESRRRQLSDFIRKGPVFQSADLVLSDETYQQGDTTDTGEACLDDWMKMGLILEKALGRQSTDTRVYQYYLPIYFWILREVKVFRERIAVSDDPAPRPLILGFSCPQGGGKTTMTTFMATLLTKVGYSVQIASLDDFYVTHKEQQQIANKYPNNPMMQFRGMPGTHDLDLLTSTLDSLRNHRDVSIPKYDKTAFDGRGDRAPKEQWKHISEKTDIVLLEGWCMGFEPVEKENLVSPNLSVVNDSLKDFDEVYKRLDGLFIIEIANMDWVFEWRLQAERSTRAAGKAGLSDEQVKDFVSRFMPAYKQYSKQLYRRPTPLIPEHELHIEIDEQRRPVHKSWSRDN